MSKPRTWRIWIAVVLIVGASAFVLGQNVERKRPGSEPYVPTRLEWLALEMNARLAIRASKETMYGLTFFPAPEEDALVIRVGHLPDADREAMKRDIERVRELAQSYVEGYKWDSWLKIREEVKMVGKK